MATNLNKLATELALDDNPKARNEDVVAAKTILAALGRKLRTLPTADVLAVVQALLARAGRTASLLAVAGLLSSGCSTFGPNKNQTAHMAQAYKAFITQQRMGDIIRVEGDAGRPANITISGANVTISTPLPPLQAMPPAGDRHWDAIQHLATEASRLGMFWLGAQAVKDLGDNNQTIIREVPGDCTPGP